MNTYPFRFYGGELVKFAHEKQRYTVRCASKRFAICTKPFNPKKTVLYTIIDLRRNVRGPEDLVFGMGAETDIECLDMLVRLLDEQGSEVSYRHSVPLDLEAVFNGLKQIYPLGEEK